MLNRRFFQELKRRKVYRVAVSYAIVAWLIAQVMALVTSAFGTPPWIMQVALVALILGFPLALILAWAYEMTPEGMSRISPQGDNETTPTTGHKPFTSNLTIAVLLSLLVVQHFVLSDKNNEKLDHVLKSETIAVLPLNNLNGVEEVAYFADGVTQEIIDELAKIKTLAVTAFSTTFPYKSRDMTNREIAEELDVAYILAGSARLFGDSVRLSIELLDPYSNQLIWNHSYDEILDNVPVVHANVARQVASNLDLNLSPDEKQSLQEISTTNGLAFKLFLQAKAEINKLNKEGFLNSRQLLEDALALDPDYAQAHTLLAWTFLLGNGSWFPGMNHSTFESEELALPHIKRSIELNPNSSDIYLVRGNLNVYHRAKIAAAKTDVDYALEINSWPRIPTNYCICTVVSTYLAAGEFEKAKELTDLAAEVDPGNLFIYHDKGMIESIEGNWKNVQQYYIEAIDKMDAPFFNYFLGWAYFHDGQYENAVNSLEKSVAFGDFPIAMGVAYLSNAYARLGNATKSDSLVNVLKDRSTREHHISFAMAILEAGRNNADDMFDWLELAFENKDFGIAFFLNVDPIFNTYKSDQRFEAIRNRMLYQQREPLKPL